jgi:hypothetical protein
LLTYVCIHEEVGLSYHQAFQFPINAHSFIQGQTISSVSLMKRTSEGTVLEEEEEDEEEEEENEEENEEESDEESDEEEEES